MDLHYPNKFSKPGFSVTWTVNFQMFKLVFEKAEEPEIKLPNPLDHWKSRRVPEKHLLLFYWLRHSSKGFLPTVVDILVIWVRTGHETTYWFQIGKGVHEGCILSPCLFNFYAEYVMRNAGLEEAQAGIMTAGRNINNLRYANDTTRMAESEGN